MLVAKGRRALLFTDDEDLYVTALASGVHCLDLFDFLLAAVRLGLATEDDARTCFSYLRRPCPHFHPHGWKTLADAGAVWPGAYEALAETRRSAGDLADMVRHAQP